MRVPFWRRLLGGQAPTLSPSVRFRFRPRLERLEDRSLLSASPVPNVVPVGPGATEIVNVGGTIFYAAADGDGTAGLWKTDGTAAGTALLVEFAPRNGGPAPAVENLTNVNGRLFFDVSDFSPGGANQLWASDGSAAGTAMVADFGGASFAPPAETGALPGFVSFQNDLYFVVDQGGQFQLWKSDGSAPGTLPVTSGAVSVNTAFDGLTAFDGQLYFAAADPMNNVKLWSTDGTAAGTRVADADVPAAGVFGLTAGGDALYFFAAPDPSAQTVSLYRSDGANTIVVTADLSPFGKFQTAAAGDRLFFTAAAAGTFDEELWVSDGVTSRELQPAGAAAFGLSPLNLHAVNGDVVFTGASAAHPSFGQAVWASDGTDAGTVEITPSDISYVTLFNSQTALAGNTLYFSALGASGPELWQTGGSAPVTQPGSTALVANVAANVPDGTLPADLVFAGGTLFYAGTPTVAPAVPAPSVAVPPAPPAVPTPVPVMIPAGPTNPAPPAPPFVPAPGSSAPAPIDMPGPLPGPAPMVNMVVPPVAPLGFDTAADPAQGPPDVLAS
jgi:ELWxxDGT repeat protein